MRASRVVARAGQGLGLGAVFTSAVVAAVIAHADLPATRRLAASIANGALAGVFEGRLAIGRVEHLSVGRSARVRVADVRVFDPDGKQVIGAEGVDATIDLGRLLASLARGGPPDVAIGSASIASADVALDRGPGALGIARAFVTKKRGPPSPPAAGESVRLAIDRALIGRATVHGDVVPPALDGAIEDARARVTIEHDVFRLDAAGEGHGVRAMLRAPRAPGLAGPIRGDATGSLSVALASGALTADAALHGDAAGVPIAARAHVEGGVVDASFDLARTDAAVVTSAIPDAPIAAAVELHATAHGKPSGIAIHGSGKLGDAPVTVDGTISLEGDSPFRLDADASHVDARALRGPESDVSAHLHAEGTLAGGPRATFHATTRGARVSGQPLPAIDLDGRVEGARVSANVRAEDPGVAVTGDVELDVDRREARFDLHARAPDLRAVTRVRAGISGGASAHATGRVDVARGTIDGRFTADGASLARGMASAERAHAEGTIAGPLASPVVDVRASADDVRLTAKDKAPLTYPHAAASARVALGAAPRLVGAEVRLDASDGASSVAARASEVRFERGGVVVAGAKVTGLGAPMSVDADVAGGRVVLRARGEDLDVRRAAAVTGIAALARLPEGSRASVDVDLVSDARGAQGHVDVAIAARNGARGEVHARLDGRRLHARARASSGSAWIEVSRADLELPGALDSIPRATGVVELRGAVDLAEAAKVLGGRVEKASGVASFEARVERGDAAKAPAVRATIATRGLDVTVAPARPGGTSVQYTGVDGALHAAYDGATDDAEVSLVAWDARGAIASADAKTLVPLVAWLRDGRRPDAATLGALPLRAIVDVARRDVGALPAWLAPPELEGDVDLRVVADGTLAQPHAVATAHASALREKEVGRGPRYAPIDGGADASWDGRRVVVALHADERGAARAKRPGHVRALVIGRLRADELLAGSPLAWDASGELDVADLELGPLPLPYGLRGAVTGRARVRDLATRPELHVEAKVAGLTVGNVHVADGDLRLAARDGSVNGHVRIHQDDGGTGTANIVSRSLRWRGTTLGWDETAETRVDYTVDGLRLAMLRPLVRRVAPEIDGRLDGRGSATIAASGQVFEGGVALSHGRVYLNAIGEELNEVTGVARFDRNGTFRVDDLQGKLGAGEIRASATGRMRGLAFESADAVIVVPSKDGVPLSAEAATFATVTGEVRVSAKLSDDREALLVAVDVPRARVDLPDRSTQALQSLDADPTITVGLRRADGTLEPADLRPTRRGQGAQRDETMRTRLTVRLGKDVLVEGRGLRVYLAGKTVVDFANEVSVTGQIDLRSGTITVQGRRFVVDQGTITFAEGEAADDPTVIATAHWDAPDRTRVVVEFSGPLKTGKLTLRSEPPFSKNEILSILLFGRPDPNAGSGGHTTEGQQATALGAGFGSSGLNKALGELSEDLDVQTDTTSGSRTRTALGYQLRRNLRVQVAYAGPPTPRERDTTYLDVEWFFVPRWSLVGTRGDTGTSILDVIFEHRY